MANIITIELCAEDRARLDKLIEAFEKATPHNCESCAKTVATTEECPGQLELTPVEEELTQAEEPIKEEPTTEAEPTEAEPVKDEVPTVTKAMVQQKVVSLAAIPAKKAAVREIVNSYAAKVSDIPEDKLAEAYTRLTSLED